MKHAKQVRRFLAATLVLIFILALNVTCSTGFKFVRGFSVPTEETQIVSLEAPFIEKDIDLSEGIDFAFWESRTPQRVALFFQGMVLPWPQEVVPSVEIKTFHNSENIFFYLAWEDDTEDAIIDIDRFSDACAIMFSLEESQRNLSLMMGSQDKANVWQWKASQDREFWLNEKAERVVYVDFYYPFEEQELFVVSKEKLQSAANDLLAVGVGTITLKPTQNIKARGRYDNGIWRVVFERSLENMDPQFDARFMNVRTQPVRFAIWNGSEGDRGGRKSISYWVDLSLD